MLTMRIRRTNEDAIIPKRAKPGDSGLDLYAFLPDGPEILHPGDRRRISVGIAIELPEGFEGQVRPRSGMAHDHGVAAVIGTVDNGYRGEVWVNLFNHSFGVHVVRHGERIAQLVVCPVAYPVLVEVDELSETERGTDGFGSTGV